MLESVRKYMLDHRMVEPGDVVIVAVSGGPDSVSLLHLLTKLSPELGFRLHAFHLDHGLRGAESAADARYVRHLAEGLGLPSTVVTLEEGYLKRLSGSVQANAREIRMTEMAQLALCIGATRVALGQNRDDQAETVLMRLLHGAGPTGLGGIRPVRRIGGLTFIRPLLDTPRIAIEEYCRASELSPRLDMSNLKAEYTRNRIRLQLIPYLAREYNPAIRDGLSHIAAVCSVESDYLDAVAIEALGRCRAQGEGVALLGSALLQEPLAVARRVVRAAAREATQTRVDLGLSAVTQVLEAAGRTDGTHRLQVLGNLQVVVEYGVCRFVTEVEERWTGEQGEWAIDLHGDTVIAELGLRVVVRSTGDRLGPLDAAFDADRLPGPLVVRLRRPGDRLWPVGMEGSKKLQDILVDAKVPQRVRDRLPLLVSGKEVLWVIGHRLDRRFLSGPDSARVLHVSITPEPSET